MSIEWLSGEFRMPRQMLGNQEYDGHLSIHDDQMAEDLGFAGAPIEGPTHFSQFVPLLHEVFGDGNNVVGPDVMAQLADKLQSKFRGRG